MKIGTGHFLSSLASLCYFAAGDSLRVRHVALDCIPGTARTHSEGGAWITQPTSSRKAKGKIACCGSSDEQKVCMLMYCKIRAHGES